MEKEKGKFRDDVEGGVFAIFTHKIDAFLQAAKEPTISWGHTLAIICYTNIVWYCFFEEFKEIFRKGFFF